MTSPRDRREDAQLGVAVLFDRRLPPAAPCNFTGRSGGQGPFSSPVPRLRERGAVLDELVANFRGLSRVGPVIVEGAPGLGKTALLNAACHLAEEEGLAVLSARGSELEAAFSFAAVRQLCERLFALVDPERLRECAGSGVLTRVGPAGDAELPAAFDDFRRAVSCLAESQPLVVAIDDLHWCDRESALWLEYLSRRLEHRKVWLIGSRVGRSSTEANVAMDRVVADPATRTFVLEPLSTASVADLVAEQFAEPGLEALAAACHRATGGNPFLLFSLLSWVRGAAYRDAGEGAAAVDRAVPARVVRALSQRTRSLPDGAVELLQAAAVLGGRSGIREAAQLAGVDLGRAKVAADALAEANVLARDDALRFVHPLERSAVYGDLGPASRATLHANAARLLDDHGAPAELVAEHLLLSEPAAEAWRAKRLVQVAERAVERGETDQARALLMRALAESSEPELRGSILVTLASLDAAAGSHEALARLQEAGKTGVEPTCYARAAIETLRRLPDVAHRSEALAVLRDAASRLTEGAEAELRLRLGVTVAHLDPTLHGAASVAPSLEQALSGRLVGRSLEERLALGYLCSHWVLAPDRLQAPQLAATALATVRTEDLDQADDVVVDAAVRALHAAAAAGSLEEAEALARSGQDAARRLGRSGAEAAFAGVLVLCLVQTGKLLEAAAVLHEVAETPGPALGGLRPDILAARVALELGQTARAAEILDDDARAERQPGSLAELWAMELHGEVQYLQGAVEAALGDFRLAGQAAEEWGVRNPAVTTWRAGAALACSDLGAYRKSHELASENLSLARSFGEPLAVGEALRVMAEVVEPVERLALLDEAVTLLKPAGPSLGLARATLELGRTLRLAERHIAARSVLRQAADLAVRCGASRLIERSLVELRASGARPRRLAFSGTESLTPSELRVAGLAAAGMKNSRIAEMLFVNTKTVEGHLSRVYQKLGVQSREQLRSFAATTESFGLDAVGRPA